MYLLLYLQLFDIGVHVIRAVGYRTFPDGRQLFLEVQGTFQFHSLTPLTAYYYILLQVIVVSSF